MAIINNVAYSWSMITPSSTALGIDEGSTTLEGVSAIKWSKKRKVESNYGMGGRPVSGFGNITYTASITMDYATQQLLRSVYGSLLEIGEFDLIISFANPMAGEDWTTTTVTLKGCIFTEDCPSHSRMIPTSPMNSISTRLISKSANGRYNPKLVMDVTFEGKSSPERTNGSRLPACFGRLGAVDLDPCSPVNRPWDTARHHYTIEDDGLQQPWFGRVFCNPPYDTALIVRFIRKCVEHRNAVALTFARTDTRLFHELIFPNADSILLSRDGSVFIMLRGTGWYGRSAVMPDRLQQRKYRGSGNMRYRREVGEATTSIVNHKFGT